MKRLTLLLPFLLLVGCGIPMDGHLPYTQGERIILEQAEVRSPTDACEFGYKKTYYITNTTSNLIFYDCLTEAQAADLDKLADPKLEPDVAIINSFRGK